MHSPEVWRPANPEHWEGGVFDDMRNSVVRDEYETAVDIGGDCIRTDGWRPWRCPEQARFVLPQGMMVTVLWTGNLFAWHTLCQKRLDPRAQPETRAVAEGIAAAMATAFPVSWPAIMEVGNDD